MPVGALAAVDGRPEHLADGLEAHAADGGELVRGQRGPYVPLDRSAAIRAPATAGSFTLTPPA